MKPSLNRQMRSMHPLIGLCCLLAAAGFGPPATAAELRVQAPVVDVEPLTEAPVEVEYCDEQPSGTPSLGELLAWDLGLNCRTERLKSTTVTGYRVFYRWDDRVYSQVMADRPGSTVPLSVRIN